MTSPDLRSSRSIDRKETIPTEKTKKTSSFSLVPSCMRPGSKEGAGKPTQAADIEKNAEAATKEADHITWGQVGKGILRGAAGLAGGAIYGGTALVGGALALAGAPILLTVVGASIGMGAIIGAIAPKSTAKKGADKGFKVGRSLGTIATLPLLIGGAIGFHTVGRIGSGLTAFALTGKREKKQKDKYIEKANSDKDNYRKKTTHEKLMNGLSVVFHPLGVLLDVKARKATLSDVKKMKQHFDPIPGSKEDINQ